MAQRWGDVLDDDSDEEDIVQHRQSTSVGGLVIPPTHKSRIDSKGIQIITSYRQHPANASQLLKTITKVKVTTEKVREAKSVEERRRWRKFGNALKDGAEGAQRSTIISKDDIFIEDPNADIDVQEEDAAKDLSSNLNEFWAKQQKRQLERKYGVEGKDDPAGGGWNVVGAGGGTAGGSGGKYIPPSARAAMAGGVKPERRTDDLNTIRVTNISENTTEADLQDLFKPFGRISRVYLAKDKETLQSRGFAFVSFVNKDDAAKAMEKLQGFGYDHLILKLEWARPNTPKDPASSGTEFRSGYGKALAQDTKEKVSYASNLTKGVR